MKLHDEIRLLGERALEASRQLAVSKTATKNRALLAMAEALDGERAALKRANNVDLEGARKAGLSQAMLDRLTLNNKRIDEMIEGIRVVAALPDPVGRIIGRRKLENGLRILKRRVPIGVIVIIYESRPNVTADAAALCLKSGNAVILRGGKEAYHSNHAIAAALRRGVAAAGLSEHCVQCVATTDRDAVRELVQMDDRVDLVIPRGGEALIRAVVEQARVPVIKHYAGVCHLYIDKSANLEMALELVENAKCQRPGVCNAVETLLIDEAIAPRFLPLLQKMCKRRKVEVRADAAARQFVPAFKEATEDDWYAEYLDMIVALRIVSGVDQAIAHINKYGSRHSDGIVTEDGAAESAFVRAVDTACLYVNASTRFTDGAQFGMGAEMGISTDKLHARGPMGLEELTSYKYVVLGSGQIRK